MKWFEGSISDAVSASKAKGAVFVVFIEGSDDASLSTAAAISDPAVSSKLEGNDFVTIKLGSGTEEYTLFTEIYRIVPIPSLFFIGGDGRPIEIVAGSASVADILTRITTVQAKTKGATNTERITSANSTSSASSSGNVVSATVNKAPEVLSSTVSATVDGASSAPGTSAQDVLDKAKALIEKTRLSKMEEEKAQQHEREEERRRVGKEVQALRRWQQDQEMKQMKEDREKEKREDLAARERVKQQIAFDKAERMKKNNEALGKKEPEKVVQNEPARQTSTSDVARLQIRMPNGTAVTTQLSATAPLSELRSFVSQQLNQPPRNFIMSTSFPRRELLVSEDALTMAELSLTPTAVVLVLPTSAGSVVRSSGSLFGSNSSVAWLFWSLLAPVLTVFNYVRGFVFGGGANNQPGNGGDAAVKRQQRQSPDPNSGQGSSARGEGARGGRTGSETTIRRQGNVHRLAQPRDSSDEENNTWNGNSTQQM